MFDDSSFTTIAFNNQNPYAGDDRLFVVFDIQPLQDEEASAKEGRPIFRDAEFVKIMVPGDKDNVVHREVRPEDKTRFMKQYTAFKAKESQDAVVGTPLIAWPAVTRAQAEELAYFGIKTVEQLAGMGDVQAQKFMGMTGLRQRAKDFLEASKGSAPLTALRAEVSKKDEEIAALRASVEDLRKTVEARVAAQAKASK